MIPNITQEIYYLKKEDSFFMNSIEVQLRDGFAFSLSLRNAFKLCKLVSSTYLMLLDM